MTQRLPMALFTSENGQVRLELKQYKARPVKRLWIPKPNGAIQVRSCVLL